VEHRWPGSVTTWTVGPSDSVCQAGSASVASCGARARRSSGISTWAPVVCCSSPRRKGRSGRVVNSPQRKRTGYESLWAQKLSDGICKYLLRLSLFNVITRNTFCGKRYLPILPYCRTIPVTFIPR